MQQPNITNRASDLAALFPLLRRAARGIVGVQSGQYVIQETIPGTFRVDNVHNGHSYAVHYYEGTGVWTCDCPDFRHRSVPLCKHIAAVWESGLVLPSGIPKSCDVPF